MQFKNKTTMCFYIEAITINPVIIIRATTKYMPQTVTSTMLQVGAITLFSCIFIFIYIIAPHHLCHRNEIFTFVSSVVANTNKTIDVFFYIYFFFSFFIFVCVRVVYAFYMFYIFGVYPFLCYYLHYGVMVQPFSFFLHV